MPLRINSFHITIYIDTIQLKLLFLYATSFANNSMKLLLLATKKKETKKNS